MKVILLQDIKGVGKKDEIINASDGHAKNYLFPKKLAVPADKEHISKLEAKKSSENHKKELEKESAKQNKEKISKITLKISAKCGENGKIFGSITSKEIAENLKKQHKIEVDKKKIQLSEPIKILGTTNVDIKLYEGIIATLKVMIVEEK